MLQSRKFQYAVATVITAVVVAFLPSILPGLDNKTVELLKDILPFVLVVGITVIGGHSITDVVATWTNRPQFKEASEAMQYLVDLIKNDSGGELLQEVAELLKEAGVKLE